ncbi:MAG: hypothetical protein ACREJV_11930 [Candidatus Rokuibacteriota bacterium]
MADSKPAAWLGPAVPSLVVATERVRPNAKLIGLLALAGGCPWSSRWPPFS